MWPEDRCSGEVGCVDGGRELQYADAVIEAWRIRQGWSPGQLERRVALRDVRCTEVGGPCSVTFSADVGFYRWVRTVSGSTAGLETVDDFIDRLDPVLDVGIDLWWDLDRESDVLDAAEGCAEELGIALDTADGWQCQSVSSGSAFWFASVDDPDGVALWVDPESGATTCEGSAPPGPG